MIPSDPTDLLALLVLLSGSTMGVMAIWAAASSQRLYFRMAIATLLLACLVAIPAYEPFVFFLIQFSVVGLGMWVGRAIRRRLKCEVSTSDSPSRSVIRFSLGSLMVGTVLVALLILVAVRMPRHPLRVWENLLLAGCTVGAATLIASWLVFSHGRWWWRIPAAGLLALLLAVPLACTDDFLMAFPELTIDRPFFSAAGEIVPYSMAWIGIVPGIVAILAGWIVLARTVSFRSLGCPRDGRLAGGVAGRPRPAIRLLAQLSFTSLTAAVALPCVTTYFLLLRRPAVPPSTVASPNGYDDVVAAGKLLRSRSTWQDPDAAKIAELRRDLASNLRAFERLRIGLSKPCEKHQDYFSEAASFNTLDVNNFRSLARALIAEGRVAESEQRYEDAARSYLDIIRLGHSIDRGGLLVDWLVGRAIEAMGIARLAPLRVQLSDNECQTVLSALRELEQNRQSHSEAGRRDIIWEELAWGWRGRLDHLLMLLTIGRMDGLRFDEADLRSRTLARLTMVELAIQAYRLRHGDWPDRLEQAVAADDWLIEDPFSPSRGTLVYRRKENGFLLYSLGPDGDDDGGKRPAESSLWDEDCDMSLEWFFSDDT